MKKTVFWSWQSDLIPDFTKNFIRKALQQALKDAANDLNLESADRLELDHDTKGEAGLVEIATTIFNKIDECEVFVADITPIGISESNGQTKKIPNPNVMIELGYALRELGHQRVITVANLNFGGRPEELPFDLRHRRGAITYTLSGGEDSETRDKIKNDLVKKLTEALKLNLQKPREDKIHKNPRPSLSLRFSANMPDVFLIRQNIDSEEIPCLEDIKVATPIRHESEQKDTEAPINKYDMPRPNLSSFGQGRKHKKFRDWTSEELNGYNQRVEFYYNEYRQYIEKYREYKLLLQRSALVELEIVNTGTLPAVDVRSCLVFPKGVLIYETNDFPNPPKKPSPPPFVPYGSEAVILPVHNNLDDFLQKSKRIADDHSSINFNLNKLQHGYLESIYEFMIVLSSEDDIKDFEAQYQISADELPKASKGTLAFRVKLESS